MRMDFASVLLLAAVSVSSLTAGQQTPAASAELDAILAKAWKKDNVKPNPMAGDEVFLRRVYLDVAGRIPTYTEADEFLSSTNPNKRTELIDQLLSGEEYVNHFYNMWADILRINTDAPANQNIVPFYIDWVRSALRENMPYDEFVRSLLTATGQAWDNGATGYYTRDRGMPLDHMANTVRIFLGTRLECAQCHDHPFDEWTQMDFYKMAAFTYGVNPNGSNYGVVNQARSMLKKTKAMPKQVQSDLNAAMTEVTRAVRNNYIVAHKNSLPRLPHDYGYDDAKPKQVIQPATMFGANPEVIKPEDRVDIYADWMTSEENPMFTTVIANRLWKKVMGAGIYMSVDEFTSYSKPSHPELMEFLEKQMLASGYDMKAYLRMILNSKVYQRESVADSKDGFSTFAGPAFRRMSAEQIWDSLVAMVNPTPEIENWKRDQLFKLRMVEQEAMIEVLEEMGSEKMVKYAKTIAKRQAELKDEEADLRKQIAAAAKAKDSKKVSQLNREVSKMRTRLRQEVVEMVFRPEMEKIGIENVAMELPSGCSIDVNPMMMDGNGYSSSELRKLQADAEKAMIEDEMKALGMTDGKVKKQYASFRKSSMASMLRAAHVGSPAKPGHFLREFGQSDRDTIENANSDASVPQALALLNGSTFNQVVHPQSVISRNVNNAAEAEEKIDRIYLSVFSRKATRQEKSKILAYQKQRGSKLYTDTVFALLNGQEFWFIQ